MRQPSSTLTGQELEIMKIVWERNRATVRDVYEALLERRKVAYTTVMTMMKILEQKKYLKKTMADRAYVYRPAQPKGQVIGDMVRDFINRVFNGSAEPLLVHLVQEHDLSPETIARAVISSVVPSACAQTADEPAVIRNSKALAMLRAVSPIRLTCWSGVPASVTVVISPKRGAPVNTMVAEAYWLPGQDNS